MTWQQNYAPLGGSLGLSALAAALPIFAMLLLLGMLRRPAWLAALSGFGTAVAVALLVYHMPARLVIASATYGAAFGLFPISWVLFWAIVLYRMTVETGNFEVIKDSIGGLTQDRRLQALIIAFAFSAFLEGAAGFGAPVAIAAAMLGGLGFPRFSAASVCLVANTAPVAFGSLGIPVLTLAAVTGLAAKDLSIWVGRICAPMAVILPAYLVLIMGGPRALNGVWPAALLCGGVYGTSQFLVSNFVGPQLTDILSSLATIGSLTFLLRFWKPKDTFDLEGDGTAPQAKQHGAASIFVAWLPYLLLVAIMLLWSTKSFQGPLDRLTLKSPWPGLHNVVQRTPPVVPATAPYAAMFTLNSMTASGTACMFAVLLGAILTGLTPRKFGRVLATSIRQLALAILTIALVLALAFVMNYSGATTTLGLAFAATGRLFPFFSAMLGWLGVFLVGSDTSANALFGNLQVVTAGRLGLNPVLMAASNSSGGVMGKMISLSSIAVAAAATGMPSSDEARLFRATLKHSLLLAFAIGLLVSFYSCLVTGN